MVIVWCTMVYLFQNTMVFLQWFTSLKTPWYISRNTMVYFHKGCTYTRMHVHIISLILSALAKNWALRGTASQSSTLWDYVAAKALDGNADGAFIHDSCTHTSYQWGAWWKVIFDELIDVKEVVITNRADCCGKLN